MTDDIISLWSQTKTDVHQVEKTTNKKLLISRSASVFRTEVSAALVAQEHEGFKSNTVVKSDLRSESGSLGLQVVPGKPKP